MELNKMRTKRRNPFGEVDLQRSSTKLAKNDLEFIYERTLQMLKEGPKIKIENPHSKDWFSTQWDSDNKNEHFLMYSGGCFVCTQERPTIPCSYCSRKTCEMCVRQCEKCLDIFCGFCSTCNHEIKQDRTFCLTCNTEDIKNRPLHKHLIRHSHSAIATAI